MSKPRHNGDVRQVTVGPDGEGKQGQDCQANPNRYPTYNLVEIESSVHGPDLLVDIMPVRQADWGTGVR